VHGYRHAYAESVHGIQACLRQEKRMAEQTCPCDEPSSMMASHNYLILCRSPKSSLQEETGASVHLQPSFLRPEPDTYELVESRLYHSCWYSYTTPLCKRFAHLTLGQSAVLRSLMVTCCLPAVFLIKCYCRIQIAHRQYIGFLYTLCIISTSLGAGGWQSCGKESTLLWDEQNAPKKRCP
jgi:hypothetical protein